MCLSQVFMTLDKKRHFRKDHRDQRMILLGNDTISKKAIEENPVKSPTLSCLSSHNTDNWKSFIFVPTSRQPFLLSVRKTSFLLLYLFPAEQICTPSLQPFSSQPPAKLLMGALSLDPKCGEKIQG